MLRLLEEFPSCSLNIFEFLRVAQPLRPRYYSASSSPRVHGEGVVQVTAGLEPTPVPGGHPFRGLGSHYLHALRPGDRLNVFLDSADGFRLQQDVTRPMIFVSAGTGLAPMRGFLWERLAMQRSGVTLAEAVLFNGIRSASQDYIYRDEIARFAAEGVLNHVHVAMSREQPGQPRIRPGPDPRAGRAGLAAARGRGVRLRLRGAADARRGPHRLRRRHRGPRKAAARPRRGLPRRAGDHRTLPPRPLGLTAGSNMDALALVLSVAAMIMFVFAASGRELRRFNEIALGLVLLTAALICQFTSVTNTHIGR